MNKRLRKLTAGVLSPIMALSIVTPALAQSDAASANDIQKHWARNSIERWTENGVVNGYPGGAFRPNQAISRAEFVTMLNGVFRFHAEASEPFADVPEDALYSEQLSIARQAGYYVGFPGNAAKPNEAITRQDAAAMLARVFELQADEGASFADSFNDAQSIAAYAKDALNALEGVVNGYPDGSLRPTGSITRAEAVTLIDNLVDGYYSEAGTVRGGDVPGNAVINHEGVALTDTEISGNLYLTAGIGDGDAELDNVKAAGTTFVSGGGEHTVTIHESMLGEVKVNRKDGRVRVVASGETKIGQVVVDSETKLELGAGTVVDAVRLNQPTDLVLGEGSSIENLVVAAGAAGTNITGEGDIAQGDIHAPVTINGQAVTEGKVAVKNGQAGTPAAPPVVTNPGSGGGGGNGGGNAGNPNAVDLVDPDATDMTSSLFAYLRDIQGEKILFGHQHATDEGFSIADPLGTDSDVKHATGDYPAIFGWDTLSLEGDEKPGSSENTREQNIAALAFKMKQAHDLGGIVTLSTHPSNPVTGGRYNDTSVRTVEQILPGGDDHDGLNEYLDLIADLALSLKDDEGNPIPIIFRPFHEQNGGWFWWGASTTSTEEYIELYRYTVEYLRDVRGVHNLLYAWSPNGTFNGGDEDKYLTTYPGDDYVDILGMDQYDNQANPGTDSFLDTLAADLAMIARLADAKGKIAAFTEYGYSPQGMKTTGNGDLEWFTKLLNAIESDPDAKKMAYMQTWANFALDGNLFVPYKDYGEYGDHELLPDFVEFYNDPYSAFRNEAGDPYRYDVETEDEQPFAHVVSPLNNGTVREATTKVRAKVLNMTPAKVAYTIEGSGEEVPMTLDSDGYYSADWSPSAAVNGATADVTVKVYGTNDDVFFEQTNTVFVKVEEILMKAYDFEQGIDGFQTNGGYQAGVPSIEPASFNGSGMLQVNVTDTVYTDDWQEMKLQINSVMDDVELAKVKRVKFEAWIPAEAFALSANPSVRAIAQLPPDWSSESGKYGMNTTYRNVADLETATIEGIEYVHYPAAIDLTDPVKLQEAEGLALSLITGGMQYAGPIYVDNVELYSVYVEAPADPAVVDTFEGYQGVDAALQNAFIGASGDGATPTLDTAHANNGNYAMKYSYNLAGSGYAGISKALGGVDWSDFNQLNLWLVSDGQNQKLVIQLKMDNGYFEYYPSTAETTGRLVEMPFSDFVPVHSTSGTITKERLANVQEFSIYTNANPEGTRLSSVMYFDDIIAVHDEDAPRVPSDSDVPAQQPGLLFGFEESAEGWVVEQNNAGASAPVRTNEAFAQGEYSLKSDFSLSGTDFELTKTLGANFTEIDSVSVKVKLSGGSAKARLYMKTGSDWTWFDGGSAGTDIGAAGFTTLTLPLDGATELHDVKSMGIKIEGIEGTGTASVYVDDVYLTGGVVTGPSVAHGFEEDAEGFAFGENTANAIPLAVTDAVYAAGARSLTTTFDLSAGAKFQIAKAASLDLSGASQFTAKAKIVGVSGADASGVSALLFVKSGAGWTWHQSGDFAVTSGDFMELTFELDEVADLDQVKEYGLQLYVNSGSGKAELYVDEVLIQ